MEVMIIATHTVKPTSPTPLKCKTHKLSYLDQMEGQLYIPIIFFYENKDSEPQAEMSRRLRQSLSEILTIFYPVAGELKENSFVDCNDRGAEFVEARVRARLDDQFIQNPKADELKQLVPRDSVSHEDGGVLLSVKASFFDCGGVAVGVCLSHKIADAASLVAFMNAWAGTCRGEASGIIHPSFDLALRFPPRDIRPDQGMDFGIATKKIATEKIATERLVFDREKVENLRKLLSSDEVKDPTKVEVVSASIWKSFIEANKAKSSSSPSPSSFVAIHAVNLRPRTVPPIAEYTFGNCVATTSAIICSSSSSEEGGRSGCVAKLRAAVRAMDDEYINNKIVTGGGFPEAGELYRAENCIFSSWRRFPMYDVDFGWGKPVWVCPAPLPLMNLVILMDTPPSQDGIEAWVNNLIDWKSSPIILK